MAASDVVHSKALIMFVVYSLFVVAPVECLGFCVGSLFCGVVISGLLCFGFVLVVVWLSVLRVSSSRWPVIVTCLGHT